MGCRRSHGAFDDCWTGIKFPAQKVWNTRKCSALAIPSNAPNLKGNFPVFIQRLDSNDGQAVVMRAHDARQQFHSDKDLPHHG